MTNEQDESGIVVLVALSIEDLFQDMSQIIELLGKYDWEMIDMAMCQQYGPDAHVSAVHLAFAEMAKKIAEIADKAAEDGS